MNMPPTINTMSKANKPYRIVLIVSFIMSWFIEYKIRCKKSLSP
jgi:hypothetical protein